LHCEKPRDKNRHGESYHLLGRGFYAELKKYIVFFTPKGVKMTIIKQYLSCKKMNIPIITINIIGFIPKIYIRKMG
jgi:hypothetical protein